MKEIERRFLVEGIAHRGLASRICKIRQGYLGEVNGLEVRVRVSAETGCITFKSHKVRGEGVEVECRIDLDRAYELLSLCESKEILKTRYVVSFAGHDFEVDEFHGRHQGLVVAEVELSEINEDVALPQWLGKEITGDDRYSNFVLACGSRGGSSEGKSR